VRREASKLLNQMTPEEQTAFLNRRLETGPPVPRQSRSTPCRAAKAFPERKRMTESAVLEQIERLKTTMARLEHRGEDLEDLRNLEQAKKHLDLG
jgi:hypothetical protein